jgi:hypothetical protein
MHAICATWHGRASKRPRQWLQAHVQHLLSGLLPVDIQTRYASIPSYRCACSAKPGIFMPRSIPLGAPVCAFQQLRLPKQMLRTGPHRAVRQLVDTVRQPCQSVSCIGQFVRRSLQLSAQEAAPGNHIALVCSRLAHTGQGVCFWGADAHRVVVFCSGALPGETIMAVVTKVSSIGRTSYGVTAVPF